MFIHTGIVYLSSCHGHYLTSKDADCHDIRDVLYTQQGDGCIYLTENAIHLLKVVHISGFTTCKHCFHAWSLIYELCKS